MALKRTELKRSKIEKTRRRNQAKSARRNERKLIRAASLSQYRIACDRVNLRDRYCLECGSSEGLEHHHAKFRSSLGADDEQNIVLLCSYCHRYRKNSPHLSKEGREKWVNYLTELFPSYWAESRMNQEITQRYNKATIGA